MISQDLKAAFTKHAGAVAVFWVVTAIYFLPLFSGKNLSQHDIKQWTGMSKEIIDHREKFHEEPLWTNSMFGGMPTYQISVEYPSNLSQYLHKFLAALMPQTANMVFLYLLGFYLLMVVVGIDFRLAMAGAFAYGFATYNFGIIEAGHNTKALAIGYFPVVIAGLWRAHKGFYLGGATITAFGLGLQLYANHLQITYYLFFVILLFQAWFLVEALKQKSFLPYLKATAAVAVGALLAIGTNFTNLASTFEYGKYSTRGPSELSEKKSSSGLDQDYALSWSYGKAETLTLLVPDIFGGGTGVELSKNSNTFKALQDNGIPTAQARQFIKNVPLYWGDQPFTSAPVYMGAIICFLFILGLFIVKGPVKWWLLSATLVSFLFAWGRHLPEVTDVLFHYLPGFNKFRTVSMALVIAGFTLPVLAVFALKEVFSKASDLPAFRKKVMLSFYISGGLCLVFAAVPGLFFDFQAAGDEQLITSGFPQWLVDAIRADREATVQADAFRSLIFIGLCVGAIWLYFKKVVKLEMVALGIGFLILADLWLVDKRYLNGDDFSTKKAKSEIQPSAADLQILEDKDPNFRVLNTTTSTFNDAVTSYFHKSIGGYHGAKLKRYQELIEKQISKNNLAVLNMLNAKYFIVKGQEGQEAQARLNPMALGNAWFVEKIRWVENADEEIQLLDSLNPAEIALVDKRFANLAEGIQPGKDSGSVVKLTEYKANKLTYSSTSSRDGFCVFSEIYYDKGWVATIDGKEVDHARVNYVLRGLKVPAGNHEIVFEFKPTVYAAGEKLSLASGVLLLLLLGGSVLMGLKNQPKKV